MTKTSLLTMMRASKLLVILATTAMMLWVTGTAGAAANDPDNDRLPTKVEKNVTHTSPRDADSDDDGIKDGNEDGDEDADHDGTDNEDQDDDGGGVEDEGDQGEDEQ